MPLLVHLAVLPALARRLFAISPLAVGAHEQSPPARGCGMSGRICGMFAGCRGPTYRTKSVAVSRGSSPLRYVRDVSPILAGEKISRHTGGCAEWARFSTVGEVCGR